MTGPRPRTGLPPATGPRRDGRSPLLEDGVPTATAAPAAAALAALSGIRSGKPSYYQEFRQSSGRLQSAIRSLDRISLAMVQTIEGPRGLLAAVLRAAGEHLEARWLVLVLADDSLPGVRPRCLILDAAGELRDGEEGLPPEVLHEVRRLRESPPADAEADADGRVSVPMTVDGHSVGGVVGQSGLRSAPDALDLAVVRILANQAAVAFHTAFLYQSSVALRGRAEQLSEAAIQQARDLAARSEELRSARRLLAAARTREAVAADRQRIARELHDSVTQYVLSAGMAVDVCRGELDARGAPFASLSARLASAQQLIQHGAGELRSAIFALSYTGEGTFPVLPRMLEEVCVLHSRPGLAIDLRLEGVPVVLPVAAEQSLARVAGEALSNAAAHSGATRCVVRLSYGPETIRLTVDDDGTGHPTVLRRVHRIAAVGDVDGRHRGLVNMAARAGELGGTFALRRSRLGGVRTQVDVPVSARPPSLYGEPGPG